MVIAEKRLIIDAINENLKDFNFNKCTVIITEMCESSHFLAVKKHSSVITVVSTHQRKPTGAWPSPLSHDNRLHCSIFHFPFSVSSDFCLCD